MSWKFQQIDPQPARGTLREEMWDSNEWVAEEKFDGDRRIAQFCGKTIRFTGRHQSVKTGLFVDKTDNLPQLNHLNSPAKAVALEGTVLDGEIVAPPGVIIPGGKSKFVTSIMGSLPTEAALKQQDRGWLHFRPFDCLFWKGEDVRSRAMIARRALLEKATKLWGNPYAEPSMQITGPAKRGYYDVIVSEGGEGVVLKRFDSAYGDRTAWVKVKKQATADVVIMGYVAAKEESTKVSGEVSATKYKGMVGAIVFGQYRYGKLWECGQTSGMDDALRRTLTLQGKRYRGRVMEIKHYGREPTGRFRHPQFLRFRNDKDPKKCIFNSEES